MRRNLVRLIASSLCCAAVACGDDPEAPAADTGADVVDAGEDADVAAPDADATDVAVDTPVDVPPDAEVTRPTFAFGTDPQQFVSEGPFPSNLYRTPTGISFGALDRDPVLGGIASEALLGMWTDRATTRKGFGIGTPVWFFPSAPVDPATLEGRVQFFSVSGTDAGRVIQTRTFVDESTGLVGIAPAWGEYMVGGTTYVVAIEAGVTTADGEEFVAPTDLFVALAGQTETGPLRDAFEPLVAWLNENLEFDVSDWVVATVFTTENVANVGGAVFSATNAFPVSAPTRRTAWDPESGTWVESEPVSGADALDAYFGTVPDAAVTWPGRWSASHLGFASDELDVGDASPGAPHEHIGAVINGSITVPTFYLDAEGNAQGFPFAEDGTVTPTAQSIVPFTLFLCDSQLDDPSSVPWVVFSHGGGAQRSNALPIANLACEAGLATIAIDMIHHSGRFDMAQVEPGLFAPVADDAYNVFTGLSEGDPGFVPDGIGDHAAAASSVSKMYAVETLLDPDHIAANLLSVATDTRSLVRTVLRADWTGMWPGLSFSADQYVHAGLSFGTSFHAALLALGDVDTAITSVGAGLMLGANLPVAPANGEQGSALIFAALGLNTRPADLQRLGVDDPAMSLLQWLHQVGDPMAWAPHVLRHRLDDRTMTLVALNDSWDDTLSSPAQLSFDAAIGAPVFTVGEGWTLDPSIPGADLVEATPWPGDASVTYGGITHTAARFYASLTCHSLLVSNVCVHTWEPEYPPITLLDEPVGELSPICEAHASALSVLRIGVGDGAEIAAPGGDCAAIYGD